MLKGILAFAQAFLFLVSSFSVLDSSFKYKVDMKAADLTSETDISFDSISAEDVEVSDEEKQLCRQWYEENVLTTSGVPAYDFTVGGKKLSKNLSDWEITLGEESEVGAVYKGGKTTIVNLKHKKSGITASVEATIYEDFATCEWTVFIKNEDSKKSPVIKNFSGGDFTLKTGKTDLYFSRGSRPANNDFELLKTDVNAIPMRFNANGGRSGSFLPFFNLDGDDFGTILSVGWTGQWLTTLKQTKNGVKINAKQENFKAYLDPNEEVRSPLVCLTFYKGGNPLKGFNTLRKWETDCVTTESADALNGYVIANEFSTLNTEQLIAEIEKINPKVLEDVDYFWMDAGWYKYDESWADGVGNWIPDANRFPNGLKPVGDKINSIGKRFLLWYEPERVREDTFLYNEAMKHDTWIVKDGGNLLWNLGDDDACEYLSKYISKSLVDNGVTIYRQDFNFTPSTYWEKADKNFYNKRKGICENHYVTNLYKYLDCLIDSVDGLMIDNCASGGKRIDIEMTRRSVPLWRSDYNCGNADGSVKPDVLEATQAMTSGLSCWIPYSGTNRYFHSEYAARSAILTNQSVYEPSVEEFAKYDDVSRYMTDKYYPLALGGMDMSKFVAMQFGSGNEGAAVIYKRENVESNTFTMKLNGLYEDKTYEVYDIDAPEKIYTLTGAELMSDGITLSITETPKAVVAKYKVK